MTSGTMHKARMRNVVVIYFACKDTKMPPIALRSAQTRTALLSETCVIGTQSFHHSCTISCAITQAAKRSIIIPSTENKQ